LKIPTTTKERKLFEKDNNKRREDNNRILSSISKERNIRKPKNNKKECKTVVKTSIKGILRTKRSPFPLKGKAFKEKVTSTIKIIFMVTIFLTTIMGINP